MLLSDMNCRSHMWILNYEIDLIVWGALINIRDLYLVSSNLLSLTLSLFSFQVDQMVLWTSGTHSTRSVSVSSTDTQRVSPHLLSIMMAPCLPSPPPTCTRRETSATQKMPSSSAKSQMLRLSPSESSLPRVLSMPALLLTECVSSYFCKEHVQLQHMLICISLCPLFNIRQLKDRQLKTWKSSQQFVYL